MGFRGDGDVYFPSKRGEFLDLLDTFQLLENSCLVWKWLVSPV